MVKTFQGLGLVERGSNMRVPKIFYDNGFEVSFHVKNKEVFYYIWKWSEDGFIRGLKSGKYNNENPKDLITLEIKSCDK